MTEEKKQPEAVESTATPKPSKKAKADQPKGKKADAQEAAPKAPKGSSSGKAKKKPKKRLVPEGTVYIQASFNNTIVTIATPDGQALAQSSAGANGFKGPKKATPYAAQISAERAAEKAKIYGMERVHVVVKGAGNGREQAIRGLQSGGLNVESIVDVTAVPHNGCRPKKTRRV